MHLILIIAAGILLAAVLLPFLGPIVMIAVCIGVIALLGYGIYQRSVWVWQQWSYQKKQWSKLELLKSCHSNRR